MAERYDFEGYASRYGVLCTDKRIIDKGAFEHQDGDQVPLVWQHIHNDPDKVLGTGVLEHRDDGLYIYGYLNDNPSAKTVRGLLEHGDIDSLSIYANQLQQVGNHVKHGQVKECSLVLSGANKGAKIENVSIVHSDGMVDILDDEAVMYAGDNSELKYYGGKQMPNLDLAHADGDGKTVGEIFDTLTDEQKNVVYFLVGQIADELGGKSGEVKQDDMEGDNMQYNVFEGENTPNKNVLSHSEFMDIAKEAKECGSFKQAFLAHVEIDEDLQNGTPGIDYGVGNLDLLFPEYQNVRSQPDVIKRDDAWVSSVIQGANKTPFSRIKTMTIDITNDIARARGYKKGHLKKEEVVKMAKRVTGPTTIYKKQRMDRDDLIDITSMDIVAWLKSEMQAMLREELARAILIGDGRSAEDEDKIDEACIRPILTEEEFYAYTEQVALVGADEDEQLMNLIDQIAFSMIDYKGSGSPTFFTTKRLHTRMKRIRNKLGAKMFSSESDLVDELGVGRIQDVPLMENLVNPKTGNEVLGIIVNMKDYNIGTNRGGETTFFDDFDIDYNQYKYLYETRLSGALTRPDCAIILELVDMPKVHLVATTLPPTDKPLGEVEVQKYQEKIAISQTGNVSGNLKYMKGYTDFSGNPELQNGHFLALKFANDGSDQEAELYARLAGGKERTAKKLDDGRFVVRVQDEMVQKIVVKAVSKDGTMTDTRTYSLSGLNLLDEPKA